MDSRAIYAKIEEQLVLQLPFVAYRKANKDVLSAFLQESDTIYTANDYSNSGFVFAPFDQKKESFLIPADSSRYYNAVLLKDNYNDIAKEPHVNITSDINDKTKEHHKQLVINGVKSIKTGQFRKVVLSRKEEIKTGKPIDLLILFQRLIATYPNAFVYLWYHPKIGIWLGATPETLLSSDGKQFFTMALAGTQLYDPNTEANWENKEVEEQEMVTEFILKELSLISKDIRSSKAYTHRAGTLLHLRTDINGDLDLEKPGLQNVLNTLHPTPAVCGLPKQEAKKFILSNEGYDRKFYTGFLGELNITTGQKTESNLFVNLRCMEVEPEVVNVYVGGGITKDSDPEKEWEETVRKTETMKKVLF
ncbi:isochorismate synthase [Aquimarina sp. AU474]|uniref:isochorismate synthase n=1 Tax=Aquimarina sp. AU474 TaxID=2108529 RepID=UPI000D69FC4B|nr:isochorismate synthase [Aquimarina sp. AU474]